MLFLDVLYSSANVCKLFDYLSFFPARNNVPDSVVADEATSEALFPPGKFCQARYAALALQARLREQIRNVSDNLRVGLGCRANKLEVKLGRKLLG